MFCVFLSERLEVKKLPRPVVGWALVVIALAFLAVGLARSHTALAYLGADLPPPHKVYDPDVDDWGEMTFRRISDYQLTIDSTFGGVARKQGKLFSTYDRSKPVGKKACPT